MNTYIGSLIDLRCLRLVGKGISLESITVGNQGHFVKIPLRKLLVWKIADELAIHDGTPVVHAISVPRAWIRRVVDHLVQIAESLGRQATETIEIGAIGQL